jgi:hypothetical protein
VRIAQNLFKLKNLRCDERCLIIESDVLENYFKFVLEKFQIVKKKVYTRVTSGVNLNSFHVVLVISYRYKFILI